MTVRHVPFLLISVLLWGAILTPGWATADEVRVFQPREQGMTPNQLRQETLYLGFAEAVFQVAGKLLPRPLEEERAAAVREYLTPSAEKYVLGYKELASTPSADGLTMLVDVDVNRRALRDHLESLGLMQTAGQPLPVRIVAEPTLTDADLASLSRLQVLSGISPSGVPLPELHIGREPDGPVRGVLRSAAGSWSALNTDLQTVWLHLWAQYFTSSQVASSGLGSEVLTVTGWFASDGAHEFDNMLRGWDGLLREVRLVDMDLLPEGVVARWEVAVTNRSALEQRLDQYLPPRGLSYSLSQGIH